VRVQQSEHNEADHEREKDRYDTIAMPRFSISWYFRFGRFDVTVSRDGAISVPT
jgi:hypothetical protein